MNEEAVWSPLGRFESEVISSMLHDCGVVIVMILAGGVALSLLRMLHTVPSTKVISLAIK